MPFLPPESGQSDKSDLSSICEAVAQKMTVVSLFVSRSLPSNGSICHNTNSLPLLLLFMALVLRALVVIFQLQGDCLEFIVAKLS
jgi:hypothetical protein